MTYKRSFYTNILIHPGMTLDELLQDLDMTTRELSVITGITEKEIQDILNGTGDITENIAKEFKYVFGISKEFWINIQRAYEEDKIRLKKKYTDKINDEVIEEVIEEFSEEFSKKYGKMITFLIFLFAYISSLLTSILTYYLMR